MSSSSRISEGRFPSFRPAWVNSEEDGCCRVGDRPGVESVAAHAASVCVWWRYSVQAKGMTAITAPAQQLRHPKRQHKQPIRANRVRECGFVGLLAVDCIARKGTNTSTRQWPTKLHATCLRLVGTEYSASTTNPVPSTPTRFKQCFHVGPSFHVFWRWKEREKAGEEGRKGGGEGRGRRRRGMS